MIRISAPSRATTACRFQVWAPAARTRHAAHRRRHARRHAVRPGRASPTVSGAGRCPARAREISTRFRRRRRAAPGSRPAVFNQTACTAGRRSSIRRPSRGPTALARRRSRRRGHLRAARRHVRGTRPLRGRRVAKLEYLRDLGITADRADAGRRFSGARATGATTASRCSRRRAPTDVRTICVRLVDRAHALGLGDADRRRLQPPRTGRGVSARASVPSSSRRRTRRHGAPR